MPKVSVVIPAYNAMRYLPETLESVLQQSFTDFEVLIVDDGSTDQIQRWVAQLSDGRVRLIAQENQGVAVARNTGIVQAQGEYIAFVDADDLWEPTKLEKQVQYLEAEPALGLVHTWMAVIDEQGQPTGRVMTSKATGNVWTHLVERNTVACASVMVRRTCFDQVGLFSPRDVCPVDVEDWEMWIRIAACYPFAVIPEPLLQYRQHPHNTSKDWRSIEQAYQIVIEKAFQSAPPELLHLKKRSYGHANLRLAWKALQSSDRNYQQASQFRQQALAYYPRLCFSQEFLRLSVAIALMRWFGSEGYARALAIAYACRRRLSNVAQMHLVRSVL
jgi:glycosyltransferase involved in cell wall biosynthesis